MKQAHRQPGAAPDEHAAHTGRNVVGHDGASGHAHTTMAATPVMTSTPVTTRRCSGAGSG